jgi:hypothetical protein
MSQSVKKAVLVFLATVVIFSCSGCGGILGTALLGGIIGHQSGEAVAGTLIGAGVGALSNLESDKAKQKCEEKKYTVTMREIKAVGTLKSEEAKTRGYEAIALRDDLSEKEKIFLIKEVQKKLKTDSCKEKILLLLINEKQ